MVAVGIDACRGGWVAVAWTPGEPARAAVLGQLEELTHAFPDARGVGIDIPIGLPTDGRRAADLAARGQLGPRRNSVFFTPIRAALEAPTHAEATAISAERSGHGISQQAYRLGPKILEADAWAASTHLDVWEVHPELSFALLLGHPATSPKKTWSGDAERRRALLGVGIELGDFDGGELAAADDVLDAAAAAWSTDRLLRGDGR